MQLMVNTYDFMGMLFPERALLIQISSQLIFMEVIYM